MYTFPLAVSLATAFLPSAQASTGCDVVVAAGDIAGDGLENTGIDPDEIDIAVVGDLELHGIDPDEIDLACRPTLRVIGVPLPSTAVPMEGISFNFEAPTMTTADHVMLARQVGVPRARTVRTTGRLVLSLEESDAYEVVDAAGGGTGVWLVDLSFRVVGAQVARGLEAITWYAEDTTLSPS